MRRRLISTAVGAWLLWGGALLAQNAIVDGVDNTGRWPSLTSAEPVNRYGRQVVQPSETLRIAWAQQSGSLNLGYQITATRNGGGALTEALIATDCRKAPPMWDCVGNLPTAVVGAILAGDVVDLKVGAPGAEFTALQVTTPQATGTCRYVAPDGTVGTRPIDTSIGGVMSGGGTGDKQRIAERIGMMRRDGWRVEWQWSDAEEAVIIMMWCVGIPQ